MDVVSAGPGWKVPPFSGRVQEGALWGRGAIDDKSLGIAQLAAFVAAEREGRPLARDLIYLAVADEENGGMMCVPNTQAYPIQCPEKADPTKFFTTEHVEPPPGTKPEIVRLKAGDVLFFNGNVIHGSHPNTSKDRFRRSFICHYVPESSAELSQWYTSPMYFDGLAVSIANATGVRCGFAPFTPDRVLAALEKGGVLS